VNKLDEVRYLVCTWARNDSGNTVIGKPCSIDDISIITMWVVGLLRTLQQKAIAAY